MPRFFAAAALLAALLIAPTCARAQQALTRPAWVERPDYVLVYPKRFDTSEVGNLLVELPNRPLRAGEKQPSGVAMMLPARQQDVAPAPVQGPELYRQTPLGPVASRLQRPQQSGVAKKQARASRRQPLGW